MLQFAKGSETGRVSYSLVPRGSLLLVASRLLTEGTSAAKYERGVLHRCADRGCVRGGVREWMKLRGPDLDLLMYSIKA